MSIKAADRSLWFALNAVCAGIFLALAITMLHPVARGMAIFASTLFGFCAFYEALMRAAEIIHDRR